MEEKTKTKSNTRKSEMKKSNIVNLKNLPPIDPNSIITTTPPSCDDCQDKYEDPNISRYIQPKYDVAAAAGLSSSNSNSIHVVCSSPTPTPTTTSTHPNNNNNNTNYLKRFSRDINCHTPPLAVQDAPTPSCKASAKSKLHDLCAANKWKLPIYQCCKEEGPSHQRLFTFMVVVEMKKASTSTALECFSDPQPKKKLAAEHAAEGALWYLRHQGYF